MEGGAATWRRLLVVAAAASLGASLAVAAVAPAAGAQQGGAPRAASRPVPRDTAAARAELESARSALATNERQLRALAASLAEREMTTATLDSLMRLQRVHQSLAARVRLLESRTRYRATEVQLRRQVAPAGPQGWLGVNVTTVAGAGVSPDGRMLVAADYPVIRSVEPGSPAARAGLQAGDRIVTIVGRDLRRESVDLARVLRPGTTVPIHLLRDGRPLDVVVAITPRPSSFGPARIMLAPEPPEPAARAGAATRVRVRAAAPEPPGAVTPAAPPAPPRPATWLFATSPRVAPVAGAEVMALTEGLRSTHDLDGGLFVVSVLPRTPADAAGLQAGDVLVRADGTPLAEPLDFLRVVRRETDGDRRVRIELVRERKERVVEMRW